MRIQLMSSRVDARLASLRCMSTGYRGYVHHQMDMHREKMISRKSNGWRRRAVMSQYGAATEAIGRVSDSLGIDAGSLSMSSDGNLVVSKPVGKGEALCTVPEALWITKDLVLQTKVGEYLENIDPWVAVSIFLIYEKHNKETQWRDYVAELPTTVSSPVTWTDEELKMLKGTQLLMSVEAYRNFFESTFAGLKENIFDTNPDVFPEDIFTYDAFLWAACTVRARSHPPLDREDFALVPIADLIQYSKGLNASARWAVKTVGIFGRGERSLVIEASRDLQQNDNVTMDFAEGRSAGQILLDFGVLEGKSDVSKAAANGSFAVNVALPESDPFYDDKLDILELAGLQQTNEFILESGRTPPEDLLATLRLLNIQGGDAFLLEALFRNETWEHMQLPVSEENESAVCRSMIDGCTTALSELPGNSEDDARIISESSPDSKQAMAASIRLGEREALEAGQAWFTARLERLNSYEYYAERRLKRLGLLDKEGKPTDWDSFFEDGIA